MRELIIDAHAHIWPEVNGRIGAGATRSLEYGRVQAGPQATRVLPPFCQKTSFPPEVLLQTMDWVGVDQAVLLQGPFYGEANEYVWRAVQKWPDRFVGAGYVDPRSPDARQTFRRVTEEYGLRILKLEMSEPTGLTGLHPDLKLDEERMAWFWSEAERLELIVTLDLGAVGTRAYQTSAVRAILRRHPRLRIVICHLCQPPVRAQLESVDQEWQDQVLLARHPHVWLDLAALPGYLEGEEYPYPTASRYVERAVSLVGAEKIMWGTDVPGLLVHATYRQLLDMVRRHCGFLSPADLDRVLGGNAQSGYGI